MEIFCSYIKMVVSYSNYSIIECIKQSGKRTAMKIIILAAFLLCTVFTGHSLLNSSHPDKNKNPPHHTDKGFVNPYPGFEEKSFGDFLYWILFDRARNSNDKKNRTYDFIRVKNDGKALRENTGSFSVTWIGHSTLLIQIAGVNILTDPIWSERSSPFQFIGPKRFVKPGVRFEDLPEIHVVIISHDHYDHFDENTIRRLGNAPLYIVPLKVGKLLEDSDITNYRELDWWGSTTYRGIDFIATPAQHFSGRSLFNRNETLWSGWVIRGKKHRVYFAGDTGYFPGFKEIGERYGPFDIAAIPVGAYMPRWFMGPVHLSPEEAVQAFLDVKGKKFLPIHWGTFDLANEALDDPPKVLIGEIVHRMLPVENFWILKHGETRNL